MSKEDKNKVDRKTPVEITVVLVDADKPNSAGHIYSKKVLEEVVKKAQPKINRGKLLGGMESDKLYLDDEFKVIDKLEASHKVMNLQVIRDQLVAKLKTNTNTFGGRYITGIMNKYKDTPKENPLRFIMSGKGTIEDDGTISEYTLYAVNWTKIDDV